MSGSEMDETQAISEDLRRWYSANACGRASHGVEPMPPGSAGPDISAAVARMERLLAGAGFGETMVAGMIVDAALPAYVGAAAVTNRGGSYCIVPTSLATHEICRILADCGASVVLADSKAVEVHGFTRLQDLAPLASGDLVLCAQAAQIANLDSLPFPDRSLVDYEKYLTVTGLGMAHNAIPIQASRGCPYRCAYCHHSVWKVSYRSRSAEHVLAEVVRYYELGVRRFEFVDDNYNYDLETSTRFFELVLREGLDVQLFFPSGLRGDLLTPEYIDLMVAAGTVNVAVALETASPRLQRLTRKNLDIDRLWQNLNYLCTRYPHVITELFTMLGFPTEGKAEAFMTLDFVKSLKWIHFPYINIVRVYLNTLLEKIALESGVSREAILRSEHYSFHQLPDTMPFEKEFASFYQFQLLVDYILLKERLLHVLRRQAEVLTPQEIVAKYDSYLPNDIPDFPALLRALGLSEDELGGCQWLDGSRFSIEGLNDHLAALSSRPAAGERSFVVLLLDITQKFPSQKAALYDGICAPLGLLYLATYLHERLKDSVRCRIAVPRMDFNTFEELRQIVHETQPDCIGIRAFTSTRDQFHETVARIRQWGVTVPIIAGCPYASVDYNVLLHDRNVDYVVVGEGEQSLADLVQFLMEEQRAGHHRRRPPAIPGVAYARSRPHAPRWARSIVFVDAPTDAPVGGDTVGTQ